MKPGAFGSRVAVASSYPPLRFRSTPNRSASAGMIWMLALMVGACDMEYDFDSGCLMGPCGGGGYGGGVETYILGFPYDEVDLGFADPSGGLSGRLQVADTVRFHLVRAPWATSPTAAPPDTVRQVTWAVSDSTVAQISSEPSGQGIFVGRNPGKTSVLANGEHHTLWACKEDACARISQIEVLP